MILKNTEITIEELKKLAETDYVLADLRDPVSFAYGTIPHAENHPDIINEANEGSLDKTKSFVIFCKNGVESCDIASSLRSSGFDCAYVKGGFESWIYDSLNGDSSERQSDIELSIRKKFHKQIFTPFAKALNEYELLSPGDKVAVCISGGKDSILMAKLFQELKRHNKFDFDLVFLVMDPGYNTVNRRLIEHNARIMGIPITIFESDIFDVVDTVNGGSPCYLCARMRRGFLYNKAKELGCNKIALGHHYDDVIETILMSMMYSGQFQTMMPKLHSIHFEGMELIRPMYLIRESNIIHWRDYNRLNFLQCACHFTETCTALRDDGSSASKRIETKQLIARLKEVNPFVESNIFRSVENVNLATVISYKKDGKTHRFTDDY